MGRFTFGPGGGHSNSSAKGTKVMLAGKPAVLPNIEAPYVVQSLTKEQIDAIPRDIYSVTIIGSFEIPATHPYRVGVPTSIRELQQMKQLIRQTGKRDVFRFVRKESGTISIEPAGTTIYMTFIALLSQLSKIADSLIAENRRISSNYGGGPPEDAPARIFFEPIDQGLMADCIMEIIARFFGSGDRCEIYGNTYTLVDFCMLTHLYFIRCKIMQNTARKPFAKYILRDVLRDETRFSVKTFNNYAHIYENDEEEFIDKDLLPINFKMHPDKSNRPHLDAFHEIGYFFYKSNYFKKLRDIKNCVKDFDI